MNEPFRTQIPNIIDDFGLDPFERTLYVHYKRTCGENPQGYSNETTETIRQKLRMSAGQVSQSRKSLAQKGLIKAQGGRPVIVTVVNIWELNRTYYQLEREQRPAIEGWTVEQVQAWLADIHQVNVESNNNGNLSSPSETNSDYVHPVNVEPADIHQVNVNGNMSTYIHPVKQRIESINRESLIERESHSPSDNELLGRQLNNICGYDTETIRAGTKKRLNYALDVLIRKKATPQLVQRFKDEYWWGTGPPTADQVIEEWNRFQEWLKKPPAGNHQKVSISAK